MEFGIEIVPYSQSKKLKELSIRIEKAGFDCLWVCDHYHNRYVHTILSQIAESTEKITLGPGVTNPYLTHPIITATAMATLDEISGGRATLGISAGDNSYLNAVGIKQNLPITTTREAIKIIRRLVNGEKVNFSGEVFTCRDVKLRVSPVHRIPIYVGGRKQQMLGLAGALADGALFNATHPLDLEECIEFVEQGAIDNDRKLRDIEKVAYMATSVDEDPKKAQRRVRAVTSFVAASSPESTLNRENISRGKVAEIRNHLMKGDLEEAKRKVTKRMIDAFSVTGTMEHLEERIEEIKRLDIDHIVIGSPIGPEVNSTIERIKDMIEGFDDCRSENP